MDKDKITSEIREWINDNKEILPLNVDYWDINVYENNAIEINVREMSFGKYNSIDLSTNKFYKPLSRIVKLR
ncbi:hypothetical protein [Flavobacterium sp. PL02]|uniref:hypothetical protein n=1 Tax=Flavobacterium sp. PL02 TaxID=3088354 RepID=UPI002B23E81A|nr:hypothetical protein [Flavobacterium sp. PL02]MEA9414325.1 hypothetical protein [Flavobacterium sp. PL02]